MIVTVEYGTSQAAIKKIEAHLEQVALYNPNWAGASFTVEYGEFLGITKNDGGDVDAIDGAILFRQLAEIIKPSNYETK